MSLSVGGGASTIYSFQAVGTSTVDDILTGLASQLSGTDYLYSVSNGTLDVLRKDGTSIAVSVDQGNFLPAASMPMRPCRPTPRWPRSPPDLSA